MAMVAATARRGCCRRLALRHALLAMLVDARRGCGFQFSRCDRIAATSVMRLRAMSMRLISGVATSFVAATFVLLLVASAPLVLMAA